MPALAAADWGRSVDPVMISRLSNIGIIRNFPDHLVKFCKPNLFQSGYDRQRLSRARKKKGGAP
jgi:hypothetical protein